MNIQCVTHHVVSWSWRSSEVVFMSHTLEEAVDGRAVQRSSQVTLYPYFMVSFWSCVCEVAEVADLPFKISLYIYLQVYIYTCTCIYMYMYIYVFAYAYCRLNAWCIQKMFAKFCYMYMYVRILWVQKKTVDYFGTKYLERDCSLSLRTMCMCIYNSEAFQIKIFEENFELKQSCSAEEQILTGYEPEPHSLLSYIFVTCWRPTSLCSANT